MADPFPEEEIARVRRETDPVALVGRHCDAPKRSGQGRWVTRCPFHEERTGSFTIFAADDPPRMHCFGCGWGGDAIDFVQQTRGLDFAGAMRALGARERGQGSRVTGGNKAPAKKVAKKKAEAKAPPVDAGAVAREDAPPWSPKGHTCERVYDYRRPDGSVAHQKIRYSPKRFMQRRPLVPGEVEEWDRRAAAGGKWEPPFHLEGWCYSLEGTVLYPYRLPELLSADPRDPVFVCEGEKDADNVASLGLVATTFTNKEFDEGYRPWFAGRWLVVVEDRDEVDERTGRRPGEEHAASLGRKLMGVAGRVSWVRMTELWGGPCGDGVDVSDWIETGRETFRADEDLRRELLEVADAGDPPAPVVYEGFVRMGERDGTILLQDVLAQRIVQHRRLLHCGGAFWQWRVRGQSAPGTWRKMRSELRVEEWIRGVMRTHPGTHAMIDARLISSVSKIMKSSNFCDVDALNGHDPFLLNCESGMLNVATGELLPHDPRHLSTTQSPVRWDAAAECPLWLSVLERIQPDEAQRGLIQEMFGYCLVPAVNYHVFFFLYGEGGTGKSTVAEMLMALVGEGNTMAMQLEELENPFMRSQLVGKQLYMAAELTPKSFKHIGLIKAIVSGDPVSVDVKYGPQFTFRPKGRFVMTSNVVAHTPDASGGFERRFLQVDFKQVIPDAEKDFDLMDKLRKELPGVLRWAVEGFQRLHARGRFERTEATLEATKTLLRNRASVKEFFADPRWVRYDEQGMRECWSSTKDLFEHYQEWCEFYGVNPYYETDGTFIKEAYRRRDDLLARRTRRPGQDGKREMGFWGVERITPPEWLESRE